MRKILAVMALILILAVPVLADISQKAKLIGDNAVEIKVEQTAWNYGSGNINQNLGVIVDGNYQMLSQDSSVTISDDYAGDINNTMTGTNLIKLDLSQYSENMASGNVAQGIEVEVEGNVQILDQDIMLALAGE